MKRNTFTKALIGLTALVGFGAQASLIVDFTDNSGEWYTNANGQHSYTADYNFNGNDWSMNLTANPFSAKLTTQNFISPNPSCDASGLACENDGIGIDSFYWHDSPDEIDFGEWLKMSIYDGNGDLAAVTIEEIYVIDFDDCDYTKAKVFGADGGFISESSCGNTNDGFATIDMGGVSGSTVKFWGNDYALAGIKFGTGDGIFEVTDVPEPASLAIFGLGLMGLGAARRRKTQK